MNEELQRVITKMAELEVTCEAYASLAYILEQLVDVSYKVYYLQKMETEETFF